MLARTSGMNVLPVTRHQVLLGGAAFSPLSLSPSVWYDFSDLMTLFQDAARTTPAALNNDPIGGVADKSGNNNHGSQSTSAVRPLLATNSQNGLAASSFTSNDKYLPLTTRLTTVRTAVFVVKWTGTAAFELSLGDSTNYDWSTGASGSYFCDYGSAKDGASVFVDGVESSPAANTPRPASAFKVIDWVTGANTAVAYISNDRGLAGRCWIAKLGEVLLFTSALSASNRSLLRAYLKSKWGTA